MLSPEERLGKQLGRGIEIAAGQLEVSWLVYRKGDANCCPSGGVVKARLAPANDRRQMTSVWREEGTALNDRA